MILNKIARGKNLINAPDVVNIKLINKHYYDVVTTFKLEVGVTYVFSAKTESTSEPFQCSVGAGTGRYSRDIKTIAVPSDGKISLTFTPTEYQLEYGNDFCVRPVRYSTARDFTFSTRNMMLEKRSLSTEFEPYLPKGKGILQIV